jgi:hypothetical protein
MARRCGCAAGAANLSQRDQSSQATLRRAARKLLLLEHDSRQIICIQVVPCFDRVLMTMSPHGTGTDQRSLSSSAET